MLVKSRRVGKASEWKWRPGNGAEEARTVIRPKVEKRSDPGCSGDADKSNLKKANNVHNGAEKLKRRKRVRERTLKSQPSHRNPPATMTTEIPLQTLNHPSSNTYLTPEGPIIAFPTVNSENPYGFILETNPPYTEAPPRRTFRYILWEIWHYLCHLTLILLSVIKRSPMEDQTDFWKIVPPYLRQHLIVITPPPNTPLPTWYPPSTDIRTWHNLPITWSAVQFMRESYVPEVHIHPHPPQYLGQQLIKEGDLIFVGGMGIFITDEIGPYSILGEREVVALEGHTIKREAILVFIPMEYTERPEVSGKEFVERKGGQGENNDEETDEETEEEETSEEKD
jgi:hypothetical protein